GAGDHVRFDQVNLAGIERVSCRVASLDGSPGVFELRADRPSGPLLAHVEVGSQTEYRTATVPVKDPGGVHDLCVVARGGKGTTKAFSLIWLEFHDAPAAAAARARLAAEAARRAEARKALFKGRPFVRDWTVEDLTASLGEMDRGRSFARGRDLFRVTSCLSC